MGEPDSEGGASGICVDALYEYLAVAYDVVEEVSSSR